MAALDFPASPVLGDRYPTPAVAGKPQYSWDGEKWTTASGSTTTAPPASALPLMDAATAVVGVTTKYAREDHVHPKISAAPFDALAYNGMQINGAMEVNQELVGAGITFTGNGVKYGVDGWFVAAVGTGTTSIAQHTNTPNRSFQSSIAVYAGATLPSVGASDYVFLQHSIEGYRWSRAGFGASIAQPVTIAFWIMSNVAGTCSLVLRSSPATRSYVTNLALVGGGVWEYKTVTIPPDTTGTWARDNTAGVQILFCALSGTGAMMTATVNTWQAGNFIASTGQTNFVNATNNGLYVTGVVVLPGIEAPSAERSPLIMRPFDQELLTCQRYFCKLGGGGAADNIGTQFIANAINYTVAAWFSFPVHMRAVPTATKVGTWLVSNISQPTLYISSTTGVSLVGSSLGAGGAYFYTNSTSTYVTADARL